MTKSKFKKGTKVLVISCDATDDTYDSCVDMVGVVSDIGRPKSTHRYNVTFDNGFTGAFKESELAPFGKATRLLYEKKV